ncbi:MAG: DUF5060 domain-containing protein [Gemmatimonadales bacterium]
MWLVLLSAPAVADPVTATLNGSIIISVTSGGYTALATELVNGVSDAHATLFGVGANADNLDLSTYFAKNGDAANWDVDLGAWIDTNGANPDFFVFEAAGNDNVSVAARLVDDTFGQAVPVSGWTNTGSTLTSGPNSGQAVHGVAFAISDLKDAAGNPLDESTVIRGLRIISDTIDGAVAAVIDPSGAGNLPPTADAGPDQYVVLPTDSVTLFGSGSDPEDPPETLDYAWTQLDGPAPATLFGEDTPTLDASDLVEGTYVFELTVTDTGGPTPTVINATAAHTQARPVVVGGGGLADSDTVQVFVLPEGGVGEVSGELRKWHRVSVTFSGPATHERADPNPFLDYRLDVTFTHSATGKVHEVPGFYAADGDAANTHADAGNQWRVHFLPDEPGQWQYLATFVQGDDVAVDDDATATPLPPIHGSNGTFDVLATDKSAPDFRAKGLLKYQNQHHLVFAETGERYLKGGADSPENFLGYFGFDNTYDTGGLPTPGMDQYPGKNKNLHMYPNHGSDWMPGDPDWVDEDGDDGKNIIGALNYLAGESINSVYFLTYNVDGGDGADTWPWISTYPDPPTSDDKLRFDASKLDQWEIVFSHMDQLGIQLHVVTQEAENDHALDGNSLGTRRKLYYRELVARFAHHHALIWNIGEENDNSVSAMQAFAAHIRALDAYDHPIAVHTGNDAINPDGSGHPYSSLYGDPSYEATSLQGDAGTYYDWAINIREKSAAQGRPWVVYGDEQGPRLDASGANHVELRQDALWGNLSGGGAGVEWYFGYQGTFGDVQSEDLTKAQEMWTDTRHALAFFHAQTRFWNMTGDDSPACGADYCLAKPGEQTVLYVKQADAGGITLDLGADTDTYSVGWYNPESGDGLGALLPGTVAQVSGPGVQDIGEPPYDADADWAAVVSNVNIDHYGAGFPSHIDLVPQIDFASSPVIPNPGWQVVVTDAPPGSTVYVVLGLAPADVPLGKGVLLVELVSGSEPWFHVGVADASGSVSFDIPIPDAPNLDDTPVYLQALVRDHDTEGRVAMSDGIIGVLHLP